ncbi:MAG: glycosyl hydrolase [Caulobacteraceae bacterium]
MFAAGIGASVVIGFVPGSAAGHDILKIDQAGISNFVQLKSHLTQSGSDVLMTLNSNDTVLLKNVTLASLTADDFSITPHNLGIYIGDFKSGMTAYTNWLGRSPDFVFTNADTSSWANELDTIKWEVGAEIGTLPQNLIYTVPILVNGSNFAAAASGAYNSYYKAMAQALLPELAAGKQVIIRPANEFNGNWFGYSVAPGQEALFVAAWQQYVDAFRSVSPNFKFEWNVAHATGDIRDIVKAYPGDAYVDYIGMDFYYDTQFFTTNPTTAWNITLNGWGANSPGLNWLESFASAHGKQSAYSEWGVNSDTAGPYIAKVAEWFATHDVAYQSYWNSNADFRGRLDNGQYPNTGAAYIKAFGPAATASVGGSMVAATLVTSILAPDLTSSLATEAGVLLGLAPSDLPIVPSVLVDASGNQVANPLYVESRAALDIVSKVQAGALDNVAGEKALFHVVDGTLSLANISYAFFTGRTPTAAGLTYLTHSATNTTDLNDAYYAQFDLANRYINFSVNLATGPGAAQFQAGYAAGDLTQAAGKAYAAIFGTTASADKISAILTAQVSDGHGGTETRAQYFADRASDTVNGLATKAAMIGWLLFESVVEEAGPYAVASSNFLHALVDGTATYNVDLLATYGVPLLGQAGG